MLMKRILRIFLLALFAAGAAGLLASCATDDSQSISSMPWDRSQPWEGPLPSTINQGR
jgi:ABC-type oligopeptide transport system substrate-binding subunit